MEDRSNNSVRVVNHDTVFELVIPLLTDSRDRDAVSLVSKRWYEIDSLTRKHVTIALCYAATPRLLTKRFPQLESLKLKGKPRASMFNLIPENWGGYASPWIEEITRVYTKLKSLHFRRMIVTDADLELLASSKGNILESKGNILEVLKLDKCSGFSTDGLLHITRSCSNLRTLFLEENGIVDNDGEWLHELSLRNRVLENLNFYMTELGKVRFNDLEVIASKCPLVSVKISDCDLLELVGFFRAATGLEEFAGGSVNTQQELLGEDGVNEQLERYAPVLFPPKLHHLGVTYLGNAEMPLLYPVAARLKKLDLLYAFLDTEGHCALLAKCPNLEILEARNVIGDRGLEVVARCCTKLKRLRIERGDDDEQGMEDEEGTVSQRGLIALAQGCSRLEYVAIYVSDITNEALESIGTYSKNMCDFRLVLLEREEKITDLPLDNGVLALLTGCLKLKRFALYLRQGGLTDVGLGYIGQFSQNIRWMLLGFVGESDNGLIAFSRGCPSLQKLELRGCCFSERAIAMAVRNLNSLRYLWVQGYVASGDGQDLLAMARPFWNIELIPPRRVVSYGPNGETIHDEHPAHILAYYSLAGHRTDFPETVVPLILSWSAQN